MRKSKTTQPAKQQTKTPEAPIVVQEPAKKKASHDAFMDEFVQ